MRQVVLNGTTAPLEDAALREGMTARPDGPGTVLAQIGQMSGEQAVRALADQGVQALAAGERVRFLIGSEVCFEDLDYVQAAAAALLE